MYSGYSGDSLWQIFTRVLGYSRHLPYFSNVLKINIDSIVSSCFSYCLDNVNKVLQVSVVSFWFWGVFYLHKKKGTKNGCVCRLSSIQSIASLLSSVMNRPTVYIYRPTEWGKLSGQTDHFEADEADCRDVGMLLRNIFGYLISDLTYRSSPRTQVWNMLIFKFI